MRYIALIIGKTVFLALHLLGRRGAALPGLIVERLFPRFLAKSLKLLPEGVIVVTGTNGKTTSTKMLTHILGADKKVLTNPTGSNFVRGITSSVIQHSSWFGKLDYDIGVFELDEAYAALFVEQFSPRGTIVLNVMRDQMDRFGEIDHTARLLQKVVEKTTDFVVLNSDDPRVANMKNHTKADVFYFAVDAHLRDVFRTDDELHQTSIIGSGYSHATAKLKKFTTDNIATIELDKQTIEIPLKARGTYNAQNGTAVVLAAHILGTPIDVITTNISEVTPAFGRGEHINVGSKRVILQLVKNPGGFRHALISGAHTNQSATMIAINDEYADGRDVSWLWDVSFGEGVRGKIITAGTRATDMRLRLKYDGIITDRSIEDLSKALDELLRFTGDTILIYTTYTAMLELRALLAKKTSVEAV